MTQGPRDVEIRGYRSGDEDDVLGITFETGFFGSTMAEVLDTRPLFTRATESYLIRHPEHCFVATDSSGVAGYAVSSPRESRLSSVGSSLLHFLSAAVKWRALTARDRRWMARRLGTPFRSVASGEWRFRVPSGGALHVNLLPRMRGLRIGSRLLESVFGSLLRAEVTRVHANAYRTDRYDNSGFWRANGFDEHSCVRTNLWEPWLDEDVELVCWTREL